MYKASELLKVAMEVAGMAGDLSMVDLPVLVSQKMAQDNYASQMQNNATGMPLDGISQESGMNIPLEGEMA